MKTILGINGSPRKKGNTHVLLETVLDGVSDRRYQTDLVHLDDMTIGECSGCHVCWKGLDCVQKDDMNDLYDRLKGADAFILGTPVYWYGPTALMKLFIDRMVYFNCPENRELIRNKKVVIVVPYEETEHATVQPVLDFFDTCLEYLELEIVDRIIAPGVTKRGEVISHKEVIDRAHKTGQCLADMLNKG